MNKLRYSYNKDKSKVVFAGREDLNASFKDLSAVCDSIRYRNAAEAMEILEAIKSGSRPVLYLRHNKHMGSRHELGGRKGRFPKKCAGMIKNILTTAMANATAKGKDPESMVISHASANKTQIISRSPSKGILYHSGGYGYASLRRSDLELAKVEIGLSEVDQIELGPEKIRLIKANNERYLKKKASGKKQSPQRKPHKEVPKQESKKVEDKPKPQEKPVQAEKQPEKSLPKPEEKSNNLPMVESQAANTASQNSNPGKKSPDEAKKDDKNDGE